MGGDRRHIRVVAGLIPDPTGRRFLVQRRPARKARALLWEFPGGKVEAGETDAEALRREAREELAVELEVGPLLWKTLHEYSDTTVELLLHAARITQGEPVPLDAEELRFLSPPEMQALAFCEADLPLLDALANGQILHPR
jgi:8-oxo-dGTP diphosphatase